MFGPICRSTKQQCPQKTVMHLKELSFEDMHERKLETKNSRSTASTSDAAWPADDRLAGISHCSDIYDLWAQRSF